MISIQTQIFDRIRRRGRGRVFISKDFLDLGSREAVDQSLSRLSRLGDIQRLGRGLYFYPRVNKRLGLTIGPDMDEIANAVARQTGSRVIPSGAVAANLLGLSTQVSAKPIYLTDGRTRQVRAGNLVLIVKHVAPREMPAGKRTGAIVIQALRYIGQKAVNAGVVSRLRRVLSQKQKQELLHDAWYTTDWIAEVIRQVVAEESEGQSNG